MPASRGNCIHVLKDCHVARSTWLAQNMQVSVGDQDLNTSVWLEKLSATLSTESWVRFIVITQTLWKHHNSIVHGQGSWNFSSMAWMINKQLNETICLPTRTTTTPKLPRWTAPPLNWLKINTDAAIPITIKEYEVDSFTPITIKEPHSLGRLTSFVNLLLKCCFSLYTNFS